MGFPPASSENQKVISLNPTHTWDTHVHEWIIQQKLLHCHWIYVRISICICFSVRKSPIWLYYIYQEDPVRNIYVMTKMSFAFAGQINVLIEERLAVFEHLCSEIISPMASDLDKSFKQPTECELNHGASTVSNWENDDPFWVWTSDLLFPSVWKE